MCAGEFWTSQVNPLKFPELEVRNAGPRSTLTPDLSAGTKQSQQLEESLGADEALPSQRTCHGCLQFGSCLYHGAFPSDVHVQSRSQEASVPSPLDGTLGKENAEVDASEKG